MNSIYESVYLAVTQSENERISTTSIPWSDIHNFQLYLRRKYDVKMYCWGTKRLLENWQTPIEVTFSLWHPSHCWIPEDHEPIYQHPITGKLTDKRPMSLKEML